MLMPYLVLAASYVEPGKFEKAKSAANDAKRVDPNFSLQHYSAMLPYKHREDIDCCTSALRKTGLPD
jgi:Tfp pilus assembly protein PilF